MTKLIDFTAFIGDIRLALTHDTGAMDDLIVAKQDYYLKLVLGEIEYLNFVNNQSASKWINFLNGCTLQVTDKNGVAKSVEYKGFKNLLAYFMYYEYIKKFENKQTAAGNRQQSIDNSVHVLPDFDIAEIYAKTIRQFYGLDWAVLHSEYNANFGSINSLECAQFNYNSYHSMYYGKVNTSAERIKGTVYNYIYYTNLATHTSFPDWNFTHIQTQAVNILNM